MKHLTQKFIPEVFPIPGKQNYLSGCFDEHVKSIIVNISKIREQIHPERYSMM